MERRCSDWRRPPWGRGRKVLEGMMRLGLGARGDSLSMAQTQTCFPCFSEWRPGERCQGKDGGSTVVVSAHSSTKDCLPSCELWVVPTIVQGPKWQWKRLGGIVGLVQGHAPTAFWRIHMSPRMTSLSCLSEERHQDLVNMVSELVQGQDAFPFSPLEKGRTLKAGTFLLEQTRSPLSTGHPTHNSGRTREKMRSNKGWDWIC